MGIRRRFCPASKDSVRRKAPEKLLAVLDYFWSPSLTYAGMILLKGAERDGGRVRVRTVPSRNQGTAVVARRTPSPAARKGARHALCACVAAWSLNRKRRSYCGRLAGHYCRRE